LKSNLLHFVSTHPMDPFHTRIRSDLLWMEMLLRVIFLDVLPLFSSHIFHRMFMMHSLPPILSAVVFPKPQNTFDHGKYLIDGTPRRNKTANIKCHGAWHSQGCTGYA